MSLGSIICLGPDAHDIEFSVSSIPQQEGQLLESIYDEGPVEEGSVGRNITGYMVPINCENSGARCVPATYEERRAVEGLVNGGRLQLSGANDPNLKGKVTTPGVFTIPFRRNDPT